MKPIIYCLEDFETHRFVLESHLEMLLKDTVEVHYFRTLGQLKAAPGPCQVLISDLNVTDSKAEETAQFLLQYCEHTPVIIQSSEPNLPWELETQAPGRIWAAEKAGHGERFKQILTRLCPINNSPTATSEAA